MSGIGHLHCDLPETRRDPLAYPEIPATAATTAVSVMKGVPIIGTAIGALTMPVVAAGASWVIGKVFIKHFASGGTLLDFHPPDYREFVKAQRTMFAARSGEVRAPPSVVQNGTSKSDIGLSLQKKQL
jgi:hypothetical protein